MVLVRVGVSRGKERTHDTDAAYCEEKKRERCQVEEVVDRKNAHIASILQTNQKSLLVNSFLPYMFGSSAPSSSAPGRRITGEGGRGVTPL